MSHSKCLASMMPMLLAALAAACSQPNVDVAHMPDNQCWALQDTLVTEQLVSQPETHLAVDLRLLQAYPFANLQMKLLTTRPDGSVEAYPFQTVVLSPQGDWLIEPQGRTYPVTIQIKEPVPTPDPGTYRFSLLHNMREEEVCQIEFVGLSILPSS